jgi:hypothetical protein
MDIKSEIEFWFSNIRGKYFNIIKVSGDFNCVSYSLDIYDGWMWTNTELWPQEIPRSLGIEGFKKLYNLYDYTECYNSQYEEGYDKIAFYSKNGIPKHACKQFGKVWRSKLGPSVIIEHQLDWICGNGVDEYGEISFIMKRKTL